jgi:Trypsin-like serine proteases, typically periplasmic, contain C-terminal PDZ domain
VVALPAAQPRGGSGSGFIIDESGLVLTNQHLFAYPDLISSIKVTLPGREEPISATLRGSDFELDLAILQLEGEGRSRRSLWAIRTRCGWASGSSPSATRTAWSIRSRWAC